MSQNPLPHSSNRFDLSPSQPASVLPGLASARQLTPSIYATMLSGALVGVVIAIQLFWQILNRDLSNTLWSKSLDSTLIYWILSWGHHALTELEFSEFFNANTYYPNTQTLAYSDSLLAAQIFYTPLRLLGANAVLALNLTLFLSLICGCVVSALGFRAFGVHRLIDITFLVFCAHGTLPMTFLSSHYQLFGFHFVPGFLLFFSAYLCSLDRFLGIVALVIFAFASTYAVYSAPIMAVFSFGLASAFALPRLLKLGMSGFVQRVGVLVPCAAVAVAAGLYFGHFRAYFEVAGQFPPQSPEETAVYSANLSSIFMEVSGKSLWYRSFSNISLGDAGHSFFPGIVLLSAGALWLFSIGRRVARAYHQHSWAATEISRLEVFSLVVLSFGYVFSLGPYWKAYPDLQLPFHYFSTFTPGLGSMRVPGRFGMFFGLSLGVALLTLIRAKFLRNGSRVLGAVLVVLFVEHLTTFNAGTFSLDEPLYRQVRDTTDERSVLVELPVMQVDHYQTLQTVVDQLAGSTIHWRKLLVGYGAKFTDRHWTLITLDAHTQYESRNPADLVVWAREQGATHILIHSTKYPEALQARWIQVITELQLPVVFTRNGSTLLKL